MARLSSRKTQRLYCGKIGQALGLFSFLFLTACASLYFRPVSPPEEPPRMSSLGALPYKEIWSGFVFNGEKVGFTHMKIEPVASETLFRITSEAHMHIHFLGLQKKLSMKSMDLVRPDLTLVSFHYQQRVDDKTLALDGEFLDGSLKIIQHSGDQIKTFEEQVGGPIYPATVINLYPVLHGLNIGAIYTYPVFDPQVQSIVEVSQSVESFEESRKLLLEPSFKVNTRMHDHLVSSWINLQGETLFEKAMGGTLITYKETEQSAKRYLTQASLSKKDLVLDFSLIRTENPIPCPRDATYLEISLEGMPETLPLLQGPGQQINKREIGARTVWVYRLRSGPEGSKAGGHEPLDKGDLMRYLGSSYHIETNHPEIKNTAEEAVAGLRAPRQRVQALVKWVSHEVKDDVEESVSALEVLHHRKGECQAHTLLYTALARAIGIPTRLVGGLVYVEGMGFLYHAWAESYVDGWIAVDPTFNQVGVDATHIKLVQGASWVSLLQMGNVIGKLKADVIDFRTSCQGAN